MEDVSSESFKDNDLNSTTTLHKHFPVTQIVEAEPCLQLEELPPLVTSTLVPDASDGEALNQKSGLCRVPGLQIFV